MYFYHVSTVSLKASWEDGKVHFGLMDLRNSRATHVAEVQDSINSETLEDLE